MPGSFVAADVSFGSFSSAATGADPRHNLSAFLRALLRVRDAEKAPDFIAIFPDFYLPTRRPPRLRESKSWDSNANVLKGLFRERLVPGSGRSGKALLDGAGARNEE